MLKLTPNLLSVLLPICLASAPASAQLGPPPAPPENPVTEAKRVLGKILFWDEQLSSDDTVACGTCHSSAAGGGDPRLAVHPGPDASFGTDDDVAGSEGVVRRDASGAPISDPLFGFDPQVTRRAANASIGAAYATDLFWDGRASSEFVGPQSGSTEISSGGGLESQAVVPILGDVEMAKEGRSWADVVTKLQTVTPMRWAVMVPPDMRAAINADPTYPDLFDAAFGDPAISAERIAFAIATYERTLVPDQTPWDAFIAGDSSALTHDQQQAWKFFRRAECATCHAPPLFSDVSFRNIGIRPSTEDPGRQDVTGDPEDAGKFKVPSLRNVGLKPTFMHNGGLSTLRDVVEFYTPNAVEELGIDRFEDDMDPLLPISIGRSLRPKIADFIENGLTDPRVADGSFPFDEPRLLGGPIVDGGCSDSLDGDFDGLFDFPDDPGCDSPTDDSERNPILVCDDGIDNDGDGFTDAAGGDPGCRDPAWYFEAPECQDGRSNDADGLIDFDGGASLDLDQDGFVDAQFNPAEPAVGAPDPQCEVPYGSLESRSRCGLGFELVLLLPTLAWANRRRRRSS